MLKQDMGKPIEQPKIPAAFGRLCVETGGQGGTSGLGGPSRLRAAVC